MKTTKLAWLISLALGTCTGGTVFAQPAPTGTDGSAAPAPAGDPAPTPVPVETPPAPAPDKAPEKTPDMAPTPLPPTAPGPGVTDTVVAGPNHPEANAEAKKEAAGEPKEEGEANVDNSQYINWANFGYGGKDYYGGQFGDGNMDFKDVHGKAVHETADEEKMSPPFLFMLLNFALFLGILWKYMRPAGNKLAEERHDLIKNALEEAAKLRKQAEDKLAEYEAKLAKADAEIKTMVEGMKADAEADKARMVAAAEASAAQMKRDAESRIAAEIEAARTRLAREVSAAAAAATEKLLRDKATADDQNKLVASFIADVNAATAQKGARP